MHAHWTDGDRVEHAVEPDTLRTVLTAQGLACATPEQARHSLDELKAEQLRLPPLLSARAGGLVFFDWSEAIDTLDYRVECEGGQTHTGQAWRTRDGRWSLDAPAQPGYHRLDIAGRQVVLAVAPPRMPACPPADPVTGRTPWALGVQVYSLRAPREPNGDALDVVGDYSALAVLAEQVAAEGAAALAISPVHAGFSAYPDRYSPYAPSSRLFLNAWLIDPAELFGTEVVTELVQEQGLGELFRSTCKSPRIDWPEAARLKLAVLRALFERFESTGSEGSPLDRHETLREAFARFIEHGGEALWRHACFEMLQAYQMGHSDRAAARWQDWPREWQDPESEAVREMAASQPHALRFHLFLQWLADRGLERAQGRARAAGMAVGLIADLAVGTDPCGAHAWSRQDVMLRQLSPGAPPDLFNPQGQSWGLTAFSPRALRSGGYAAYIEMLRASFRHAGGIRVDHAMGLQRLWLVPDGASPTQGTYQDYPFDDMLNLLALEAWRHDAVVIGENLGTVAEDFDRRTAEAGMLGMSVLWFTQGDDGRWLPPQDWSPQSAAMSTTHDLPTIAGWWSGHDIGARAASDLLADADVAVQRRKRDNDRRLLWQALTDGGFARTPLPPFNQPPIAEILAWLAATPAPLVIVSMEDVLALRDQPNLPGTVGTHPNWLQRLPCESHAVFSQPAVARRMAALRHPDTPPAGKTST